MKKPARSHITVLLTIFLIFPSVCSKTKGSSQEIRIGLIAPMTGKLHKVGTSVLEGAQLAVDEKNGSGGVEAGGIRYRVVTVIKDCQNKPELAVIKVDQTRRVIEFTDVYQSAFGRMPTIGVVSTYDCFSLLFRATDSQNSIDPELMCKGLAKIERYVGVGGVISFGGSPDPEKSAVIIHVEGGRFCYYS